MIAALTLIALLCCGCNPLLERSPHLLSGECSITVEVEPPASLAISGKSPPQPQACQPH